MSLFRALNDPEQMAGVHGWLAALWLVLAIGTTGWAFHDPENRYLLAWVIFMSAYANAAAHWAARQGAAPSAEEGAAIEVKKLSPQAVEQIRVAVAQGRAR